MLSGVAELVEFSVVVEVSKVLWDGEIRREKGLGMARVYSRLLLFPEEDFFFAGSAAASAMMEARRMALIVGNFILGNVKIDFRIG